LESKSFKETRTRLIQQNLSFQNLLEPEPEQNEAPINNPKNWKKNLIF